MNTNEQKTLSEQLLQRLHINQLEALCAATLPEPDLEPVRRRADAAHTAIAKAGRLAYAHWGVACLLLAAGLVVAGILVPSASNLLGVGAAFALATGLLLVCMSDPKLIVRHLDVVDSFVAGTGQDWERKVTTDGQDRVAGIIASVGVFPQQALLSGSTVSAILDALRAAATQTGRLAGELEQQLSAELQSLRSAEDEWNVQASRARAKARTLPAKLWTRPVRQAAHRALEAREAAVVKQRRILILRTLSQVVIQPVSGAIAETIEQLRANVAGPLASLRANASRTLTELSNRSNRDLFSKLMPSQELIASSAREAVRPRLAEIFQTVAGSAEGNSTEKAVTENIGRILAESAVLPNGLSDCLQRLNGGAESAMIQLDAEAMEFAVAQRTPGRPPRRLRTVMVANGQASPLYKAIAERSEGSVCRPLDHDRDDELIVASEERHQPGCELVDLVHSSKALDQIPADLKAAMIVAVEDPDLVLSGCHPEQRTDPDHGLRLVSLGLAYDRLPRQGNQYLLDGNDSTVRGFEAAVTAVQTDEKLAEHLEIQIREFVESYGIDRACKDLEVAIARRGLAPASHVTRVRQVLREERSRLQRLMTIGGRGCDTAKVP